MTSRVYDNIHSTSNNIDRVADKIYWKTFDVRDIIANKYICLKV